jgi:hypothetical protein
MSDQFQRLEKLATKAATSIEAAIRTQERIGDKARNVITDSRFANLFSRSIGEAVFIMEAYRTLMLCMAESFGAGMNAERAWQLRKIKLTIVGGRDRQKKGRRVRKSQ